MTFELHDVLCVFKQSTITSTAIDIKLKRAAIIDATASGQKYRNLINAVPSVQQTELAERSWMLEIMLRISSPTWITYENQY